MNRISAYSKGWDCFGKQEDWLTGDARKGVYAPASHDQDREGRALRLPNTSASGTSALAPRGISPAPHQTLNGVLRLTVIRPVPTLQPADYSGFMGWFARDKEKERFYLLPGMGGRNLRRKRTIILRWSIVAGLFTSAALAILLYFISKS